MVANPSNGTIKSLVTMGNVPLSPAGIVPFSPSSRCVLNVPCTARERCGRVCDKTAIKEEHLCTLYHTSEHRTKIPMSILKWLAPLNAKKTEQN